MEDVAKVCICNFNGESHLFGEAGETVLDIPEIKNHLVLADGPAGLRIVKKYGEDENGKYRLCVNPIEARLIDYLTKEEYAKLDTLENNLDRKGTVYYQYATAIPTGTSLAQSFNEELVEIMGNVVGNEMEIFKVNIWLAPGMNIHRNIQNGRNFEYFSEDPLLTGKMAAAMTRGVKKHTNRAVTIKHFACNNQEMDRFNDNSIVSERALRELYLKGFKIALQESNPISIMTSYNLLNGKHTSERRDLLIDVLRIEWGFQGLIMSDWFSSNDIKIGLANHPNQHIVPNILGGNNLKMWGSKVDYDLVLKSIQDGNINTMNLLECASKVYDTIELLNQ
jgi:beta-glucosidase